MVSYQEQLELSAKYAFLLYKPVHNLTVLGAAVLNICRAYRSVWTNHWYCSNHNRIFVFAVIIDVWQFCRI